jgi:predicted Zn-dependent protease
MSMTANFEAMLAQGKDSPLLRFSLGNAYLQAGDAALAATHLQEAVKQDANYSAAWKLLGKARVALGEVDAARAAYEAGIVAATARGDKQAVKEMTVFLKRLGVVK